MAMNRHFYGAAVLPRSMAQELEEMLNGMGFWHLWVKPFARLCSVKEACERSEELANAYEEAAEETPDEDMVLFIAEGWGKYGVSDTVGSDTIFLIQTEGDESYELYSGWDTYTDEEYGFGSYVVSELDGNNMFGFVKIDKFLSEIAPDFPKPRFKYLSQEELTDEYSATMFLPANPPAPPSAPTPQTPPSAPTPPASQQGEAQTGAAASATQGGAPSSTADYASQFRDMLTQPQADLKAALAKEQADLKKSLDDMMAESRKALDDALKDALKGL